MVGVSLATGSLGLEAVALEHGRGKGGSIGLLHTGSRHGGRLAPKALLISLHTTGALGLLGVVVALRSIGLSEGGDSDNKSGEILHFD
jgi:hypothetical protein